MATLRGKTRTLLKSMASHYFEANLQMQGGKFKKLDCQDITKSHFKLIMKIFATSAKLKKTIW